MLWDWGGPNIGDVEQSHWLSARREVTQRVLEGVDRALRVDMPALVPVRWQSDAQRRYLEKLEDLERELAFIQWQLNAIIDAIDRALSAIRDVPVMRQ